jgi:hypothetical protein
MASPEQNQPEQDQPELSMVVERYGRISEMDRSFDVAYWQRQGPAAIFEAAWQLVVEAHSRTSQDPDELRLRRSLEKFQRQLR